MTFVIKPEPATINVSRLLARPPHHASRRPPIDIGRPELGPLLSVLFLMLDELGTMVLNVASSRSGVGVTTVARDIAAAAGAAGWCRVALLDGAPGRAPKQEEHRWPGLLQMCERGESLALRPSFVGPTPVDLGLLTASRGPVTHVETLRRLYNSLRRHYTLIIIDCPPILVGQQTLTLAPAADETLLVMEAERTPAAEIRRAHDELERRGASVLGLVLNKRRRRLPTLLDRLL